MNLRSLARSFFGIPEPTRLPAPPPPAPLGNTRPLGPEAPQRWCVYEGHGVLIGTATEHPTTKRITARWDLDWFPKAGKALRPDPRTVWVDIAAFKDDMWDYSRLGFVDLHGLTRPLRVRNTDRTRAALEGQETPGW